MIVKLNSKNTCLVCFKKGNLVEHYVSFDAKIICYVHNECHKKIHDGQRPDLMHYQEKDSTKSCLKKIQTYKQKIEVIGSKEICHVCKEEPEIEKYCEIHSSGKFTTQCNCKEDKIRERKLELIVHHIRYFPPKICYVHHRCHTKIHDGQRPDLIEYEEGDSRKFYNSLKNQ